MIVILDDTSVAMCDYKPHSQPRLIDIDQLKAGLLFAMKRGLAIQVIYPDYTLPQEYVDVLASVDIFVYRHFACADDHTDILIYRSLAEADGNVAENSVNILHTTFDELRDKATTVLQILKTASRVNLVISDIDSLTDQQFDTYGHILESWVGPVAEMYLEGLRPQLNALTDRINLYDMNNCNAGYESITLAPDGKFYVCPAFYFGGLYNIGDAASGVSIANAQLYDPEHAPICSVCDAYQCRRCIFRNLKRTLEVNIPGRKQCVAAHKERNAARLLLKRLKTINQNVSDIDIEEIDYTDPLEKLRK